MMIKQFFVNTLVSMAVASIYFGLSDVIANKTDDADPKIEFNIEKSTSDTVYVGKDKCVSYGNGTIGIGDMTAQVTATTTANRAASFIYAQPWVVTPNGAVIKGPGMSDAASRIFSSTFDYPTTCLFSSYPSSQGYHRAKSGVNDPNKPSLAKEKISDKVRFPVP